MFFLDATLKTTFFPTIFYYCNSRGKRSSSTILRPGLIHTVGMSQYDFSPWQPKFNKKECQRESVLHFVSLLKTVSSFSCSLEGEQEGHHGPQ